MDSCNVRYLSHLSFKELHFFDFGDNLSLEVLFPQVNACLQLLDKTENVSKVWIVLVYLGQFQELCFMAEAKEWVSKAKDLAFMAKDKKFVLMTKTED